MRHRVTGELHDGAIGRGAAPRLGLTGIALLVLSFLVAAPAAVEAQVADPFATLTTISDGNPGTDDRGYASSETNATAFKNQSLVTVGDYQLTSYYGADQTLILGRRNLVTSPDSWYLLHTGLTSNNVGDSHTVSTIGVDGDGYLHVAWGVHNNPLKYTESTTSVLNDAPFSVAGELTGQIPLQGSSITYPEFWSIPGSGDLLLSYRTGGSGNGEYQLSRWSDGSNSWTAVHAREGSGSSQTGLQPWIDNDYLTYTDPPNVNAYQNGLVHDSTGRLHMSWTWRTGGDSTTGFTDYQSNHNIMYAYSDNNGVDWYKDDGTLYQRNGQHDIDEDNATPVIPIPDGSSLINQASSAIGPDDTYYAATWWAPEAASGNHLRQYMLVAYNPYDASPQWRTYQVGNRNSENGNNRVPESQLGTYRMSRPIVMTDESDRVFVVFSDYQRGQGVTVAYSEDSARDDWQFVDLTTEDMRLWEPKYDVNRWNQDGVLSMLYQPSGGGLAPNDVSILEWDARAFFTDGLPLTLQVDRATGAVTLKNSGGADVAFTAYTIGSATGQLAPGGWISFADQSVASWAEAGASPTSLSEASGTGSLLLDHAASVSVGNAFAGQPIAFGVDGSPDLAFEYTVDGSPHIGTVEYVGQSSNNLMLLVDPDTGEARLKNISPFSVAIDGYTIASDSASLDPADWISLDDQNAESGTWSEANVTNGRLSELQAVGQTLLNADDTFYMGDLFNPAGQPDLVFQFLIAGQEDAMTGVVLYTSIGVPGDYNEDGVVDAADYTVWRDHLNQSVTLPNDETPGLVTESDYAVWRAHFGETSAAGSGAAAGATIPAVPEPACWLLLSATAAGCPFVLRRRSACQGLWSHGDRQ